MDVPCPISASHPVGREVATEKRNLDPLEGRFVVYANAAHRDTGTFNLFLPSDVCCGYGGGSGDVKVRVLARWSCMLYRSLWYMYDKP